MTLLYPNGGAQRRCASRRLWELGLVRCVLFFIIDVSTRRVEVAGIAAHANGTWMQQIGRNLTDALDGFLRDTRDIVPIEIRSTSTPSWTSGLDLRCRLMTYCGMPRILSSARKGTVATTLVVMVGLALSCSEPLHQQPQSELPSPSTTGRALFEAARDQGGFVENAYFVWSPIWPSADDEVRIFYDTRAQYAVCDTESAEAAFVILHPEEGEPIRVPMRSAPDGILQALLSGDQLRPGWFGFRQGDLWDNNCSNPWKLSVVSSAPEWRERSSAHFTYRWLPGDPVEQEIEGTLASLESRLGRIVAATGLDAPERPVLFLHLPIETLGTNTKLTGGTTTTGAATSSSPRVPLTTRMSSPTSSFFTQVGRHVGLLDEGVAIHFGQNVAADEGWRGRDCDEWAREARDAGRLPALAQILRPPDFYGHSWEIVGDVHYPVGCSFVRYLVERFGRAPLLELMRSYDCARQNDVDRFVSAFSVVYGVSLSEVETDWLAQLGDHPRDRRRATTTITTTTTTSAETSRGWASEADAQSHPPPRALNEIASCSASEPASGPPSTGPPSSIGPASSGPLSDRSASGPSGPASSPSGGSSPRSR